MRNKREGLCHKCGKLVKVGERFFKRVKGVWKIKHAKCYNV